MAFYPAMDTIVDSVMEPILELAIQAEQRGLVIDAEWTAQNFTPLALNSLQDALGVGDAFPPVQMTPGGSSDDGFFDPTYTSEDMSLESTSPALRQMLLNYSPTEAGFTSPAETGASLTSDGKEGAKERRRSQNRLAQRAYRQRKEQALEDQRKEIEALKSQLEKEKQLKQALAKAVELLKERLKGKQPESGHGAAIKPNTKLGLAPLQRAMPSRNIGFSDFTGQMDYSRQS